MALTATTDQYAFPPEILTVIFNWVFSEFSINIQCREMFNYLGKMVTGMATSASMLAASAFGVHKLFMD